MSNDTNEHSEDGVDLTQSDLHPVLKTAPLQVINTTALNLWNVRYDTAKTKAGKLVVKIHDRELTREGFVSHFTLLFTQVGVPAPKRDWSVTFQLYNTAKEESKGQEVNDNQSEDGKELEAPPNLAYMATFLVFYAFNTV